LSGWHARRSARIDCPGKKGTQPAGLEAAIFQATRTGTARRGGAAKDRSQCHGDPLAGAAVRTINTRRCGLCTAEKPVTNTAGAAAARS
jgi:hypothetical protein